MVRILSTIPLYDNHDDYDYDYDVTEPAASNHKSYEMKFRVCDMRFKL